ELDARMANSVDQRQSFVEARQDRPLSCTTGVHRLDSQDDVALFTLGQELAQGRGEQTPGVILRMPVAAAAIDDQAISLERTCQTNCLARVIDALVVTVAVAASETTGPEQVRNFQSGLAEQI